jgi:hypothetical protein
MENSGGTGWKDFHFIGILVAIKRLFDTQNTSIATNVLHTKHRVYHSYLDVQIIATLWATIIIPVHDFDMMNKYTFVKNNFPKYFPCFSSGVFDCHMGPMVTI